MANLLICYPDRSKTATLSGGSWQATLPLDNLKTLPLATVARSTNATLASTQMVITLDTSRAISILVLCGHNLSVNAQYRVTAASDSEFADVLYQSDWTVVWPILWSTDHLEWEDDRWWDGTVSAEERETYVANLIHPTPLTLARYWKLELDDQTNSAGYVQAGRMFISTGWQPQVNFDYGAAFGYESTVQSDMSLGGQQYFNRQAHQRVFRLALSWLDWDEAHTRIWEIQRALGLDQELFVIPDLDDALHTMRRAFLARQRTLNLIEQPSYLYYQNALEFLEVL